jgi:Acetyltransferase (GNAT) domain
MPELILGRGAIVKLIVDATVPEKMPRITSKIVDTWEQLEEYSEIWDQLWEASHACRTECYAFEWIRLDAEGLNRICGHPWCLFVYEAGTLLGIVPLYFTPKQLWKLSLNVSIKTLTFSEERPNRHGILTARNKFDVFFMELIKQMNGAHIDCAILSGLSRSTVKKFIDGVKSVKGRCTIRKYNELEANGAPGTFPSDLCAIDTSKPWEEYLASKHRQLRNNIRRAYRLASKFGQIELWRYLGKTRVSGKSLSLDEMVTWIEMVVRRSWQAKVYKNRKVHSREYIETAVSVLMRNGILDLGFLLLDGKPIAYCYGSVTGQRCTVHHTGYDEIYRRISPGLLLFTEMIKDSSERGIDAINLMGSTYHYKHQLADIKDSSFEFTLYGNTAKGLFIFFMNRYLNIFHISEAQFSNGMYRKQSRIPLFVKWLLDTVNRVSHPWS